jgi:hypothetical protein
MGQVHGQRKPLMHRHNDHIYISFSGIAQLRTADLKVIDCNLCDSPCDLCSANFVRRLPEQEDFGIAVHQFGWNKQLSFKIACVSAKTLNESGSMEI